MPNYFDLTGRSAVVTGAAGGIGRSVAKAFAQEGAKLLLADIQDEKAHDVAVELNREGGGQCIACAVDVVQPPPSSLTMCAPARMSVAVLRTACSTNS